MPHVKVQCKRQHNILNLILVCCNEFLCLWFNKIRNCKRGSIDIVKNIEIKECKDKKDAYISIRNYHKVDEGNFYVKSRQLISKRKEKYGSLRHGFLYFFLPSFM